MELLRIEHVAHRTTSRQFGLVLTTRGKHIWNVRLAPVTRRVSGTRRDVKEGYGLASVRVVYDLCREFSASMDKSCSLFGRLACGDKMPEHRAAPSVSSSSAPRR